MEIKHPNVFEPKNVFEVTIIGDDLFEPQEEVMISLNRPMLLDLPAPFKASKTASPPNSVVKNVDQHLIVFQLPSTKIVLRGGK